ncbi:MAG: hypothetical protein ACOCYR_08920 [Erythrobacter sp.]
MTRPHDATRPSRARRKPAALPMPEARPAKDEGAHEADPTTRNPKGDDE